MNIWKQIGQDIDGETADDQSGASVILSSDGRILAIGAIFNDGGGTNSGHVRVYKFSESSWNQIGQDIDGESANDFSGQSISLSSDGRILAIGSGFNDGGGTNSGHVRVYKFSGSSWTQIGQDIDGEAANDNLGGSISLSSDGRILAIGANNNDGGGTNSGHVRVYKFSGSSWTQIGQDIDGETANDFSGWSISLSSDGTILAIGAIGNDGGGNNSGHVRVYRFSGSIWTQIGQDIDGESTLDQSGQSVSLSSDGRILAIGANLNDGGGSNSGHVRVYKFSGSTWTQIGQDIDGEAANDNSGVSVSLSSDGRILAIGANTNDGWSGIDSGHVRVYKFSGNTWTQLGQDIDGETANDNSGGSVSLSSDGRILAIGAIGNDDRGSDSGHVRVYKLNRESDGKIKISGGRFRTNNSSLLFLFILVILVIFISLYIKS